MNIEKLEVAKYLFSMLIKSMKESIKSQGKEDSEMLKARLMECHKNE